MWYGFIKGKVYILEKGMLARLIMEWYFILGLVFLALITIMSIFVAYKVRIITNFKTLTDKVWNEEDIEAIASLLGITVEIVVSVLAIFGIRIPVGDG